MDVACKVRFLFLLHDLQMVRKLGKFGGPRGDETFQTRLLLQGTAPLLLAQADFPPCEHPHDRQRDKTREHAGDRRPQPRLQTDEENADRDCDRGEDDDADLELQRRQRIEGPFRRVGPLHAHECASSIAYPTPCTVRTIVEPSLRRIVRMCESTVRAPEGTS